MNVAMSVEELDALPVAVDLVTAARAFGISKTKAYELVRDDEFPVPVLRVGRLWRVARAEIFRALGHEPTLHAS